MFNRSSLINKSEGEDIMKELVQTVIKTIDSREIADMLGVKHYKIIERLEGTKDGKYKGIIPILTDHNFVVSDYFILSSYKDSSGRENKSYLFTKIGCDFIANKFQGEKGILFSAKYVKKFEEIESENQESQNKLVTSSKLETQIAVLREYYTKIDEIKAHIDDFKNSVPLYSIECKELQALVRKVGIKALGGYKTPAYNNNSLRSKVYSDIQHQLRREFGVERYEAIKRCQFEIAKKIIEEYKPPTVLVNQITLLNSEISLDLAVV